MYINKKLHTSSRFARSRAVSKLSTFLYTLYIPIIRKNKAESPALLHAVDSGHFLLKYSEHRSEVQTFVAKFNPEFAILFVKPVVHLGNLFTRTEKSTNGSY